MKVTREVSVRWFGGLIVWGVSAVLSFAAAQTVPARYLLTGTLGGEQVQLELVLSPDKVTGTLLGTPLQNLQGEQTRDGKIHLSGAGLNLTGRLPEPFLDRRDKAQTFSGTLANGDPFSLKLAASYTVRRTEQGPFLQTRTEVPFWLIVPWRKLNGRLEGYTAAPTTAFIRDAQRLASKGELAYPYTYESALEPTLWSSDTLSLLETSFYYTGGAHPNTGYRSLTFHRTGKEVVRLGLKDLFLPRAAYLPVLLREIDRKLRARHAAWIEDGSVKLKERDFSVFNLTERGLEFTFAPYAVAPYAQGKFAITVPYTKLQGLLKPGLLP